MKQPTITRLEIIAAILRAIEDGVRVEDAVAELIPRAVEADNAEAMRVTSVIDEARLLDEEVRQLKKTIEDIYDGGQSGNAK